MTAAADLGDGDNRALLARGPVALLPLGALESHGEHLPAGTDNILAERLALALECAVPDLPVWRLPLVPYGQVWSLEQAPGSLGISGETLVAVLTDIARGAAAKGCVGLAVVNAHLGNAPYIREVQRRMKDRDFVVADFFYPGAGPATERLRRSPVARTGYMHACEIETSFMLHLAPEAVRMDRAVRNYPDFPPDFGILSVRWTEFTDSPVLGDATAATADKGAEILADVVAAMATILRRIHAGRAR